MSANSLPKRSLAVIVCLILLPAGKCIPFNPARAIGASTGHVAAANSTTANSIAANSTAANSTAANSTAANSAAANSTAARSAAARCTAANSKAARSTAANSTAANNTAAHSNAANSTAANSTAANSTAANSTAANSTAANSTAANSTAANSTAANSTAVNSTAAHSTAANSTAANSTAANSTTVNSTAAALAAPATAPVWNNSLMCLTTVPQQPGKPPAIAPVAFSRKDFSKCGRYQYQCSKGDTSCTAGEQASKSWKWAYVPMAPRMCVRSLYMDISPGRSSSSNISTGTFEGQMPPTSRHVFCCGGNACNVPDRRFDTLTQVLPAQKDLEKVPSSWRACLSTQRRVGSLLKSKKFKKADGFVACVRYQYMCNSTQARPPNATTCSTEAVQSGAWEWHYTAMTQQDCDKLPVTAARLRLRYAACCFNKDNCNVPDKRLDNTTVVVKWTGLVTSSTETGD